MDAFPIVLIETTCGEARVSPHSSEFSAGWSLVVDGGEEDATLSDLKREEIDSPNIPERSKGSTEVLSRCFGVQATFFSVCD